MLEGQTEHVLCLYYKDDSRNHELAERNKQEYCVKYRYWKSDEATLKGQYSSEFLDKLPESERKDFTGEKEVIEFRDGHCAMNPPSDKDFTESLSRSPNESLQGTEPNGEFTEPQRTRLKRAVLNIVQGIDEHQEI